MSAGTPAAEIEIDADFVRELLAAQQPDLAPLPVQAINAGWDNAMFRLGDDLAVRLPRRQAAAKLIENEQTWLPQIAERLSLPAPVPLRCGQPTEKYPWRWSVLPWLQGTSANLQPPHENQAQAFAQFLRTLHAPAPENAPRNEWRGVPIRQRAENIGERLQRLAAKTNLITPAIFRLWDLALSAPESAQACWLHGDLHARNILVHNGAISGIIDWGDITAGDAATDLAAIWMLFESAAARAAALHEYTHISEATLQRAKGWAILFGVVLLDTGLIDNPEHAAMGENTLRRVAEF